MVSSLSSTRPLVFPLSTSLPTITFSLHSNTNTRLPSHTCRDELALLIVKLYKSHKNQVHNRTADREGIQAGVAHVLRLWKKVNPSRATLLALLIISLTVSLTEEWRYNYYYSSLQVYSRNLFTVTYTRCNQCIATPLGSLIMFCNECMFITNSSLIFLLQHNIYMHLCICMVTFCSWVYTDAWLIVV